MSWSFAFHGKASRVAAEVQKQDQTFSIAEEQSAFNSAKQTILDSLAGTDGDVYIFVQANGSAVAAGDFSKKRCIVTAIVSEAPFSLLAPWPGQRVE